MPLKSIELCHIDPSNRAEGKFTVTINGDRGLTAAVFMCTSERDAIALRNAIRDHADELIGIHDYSR